MKKFRHFRESLDDELFVEEIEVVDEDTTHFTFDDERSADKLVAKLKRRGIKAKRNGGGGKTHTVTVYSKNKGHHKVAKSSVHKRADVESKLGKSMQEGSETWAAGYERRVVKTTKPEHKEKGFKWRIKGKDRPEISIKLYKTKPDFAEFKKQMRRVAGHEFGG
jgi:hypothetical protein